eukprot:3050036-Pleurochrysis_carterae.AAC.3
MTVGWVDPMLTPRPRRGAPSPPPSPSAPPVRPMPARPSEVCPLGGDALARARADESVCLRARAVGSLAFLSLFS